METDIERKGRQEKMVATTQLRFGPGDGERKKSKKRNEFNLDLISKTFFSSRNELTRVMGTIFLVIQIITVYMKNES